MIYRQGEMVADHEKALSRVACARPLGKMALFADEEA
jgi:hypothetical protein